MKARRPGYHRLLFAQRWTLRFMAMEPSQVVCPYCGHVQTSPSPASGGGGPARCGGCGGMLDALSIKATQIEMGPWFILDQTKPFLPGCSYAILKKRIEAGRVTAGSIIRGPTTHQLWAKARHVPCVGHLLGYCHACGVKVEPTAAKCRVCGVPFSESTERNELGLRYATVYAAVHARAELEKQIADAETQARLAAQQVTRASGVHGANRQVQRKPGASTIADTKAKTPVAPGARPGVSGLAQVPKTQGVPLKKIAVDDLISMGWSWAQAPAAPIAESQPTETGQPREPEPPPPVAAKDSGQRPAFAAHTRVQESPADSITRPPVVVARLRQDSPPSGRTTRQSYGLERPALPALVNSTGGWGWLLTLTVLFLLLFSTFLQPMARLATATWPHAWAMPLIAGFFLWRRRHALAAIPKQVRFSGLLILFVAIFGYAWAVLPATDLMGQGYSMVVALFGLLVMLLGWQAMKHLWLPLLFLALGVKISDDLWLPPVDGMQHLMGRIAVLVLQFFSLFTSVSASLGSGTVLLSHEGEPPTTWVIGLADVGAGLRLLPAFLAMALVVAYIKPLAWWQRLALILLAAPVAIAVHVGRIAILGISFMFSAGPPADSVNPRLGWLTLIPAGLLLLLAAWLLRRAHPPRPPVKPRDATTTEPVLPVPITAMERFNRISRGIMAGGASATLLGVIYGLLVIKVRPDLAGPDWSSSLSTKLLIGAGVAMVTGLWFLRLTLKPEINDSSRAGRHVTLGIAAGVMLVWTLGIQGLKDQIRQLPGAAGAPIDAHIEDGPSMQMGQDRAVIVTTPPSRGQLKVGSRV